MVNLAEDAVTAQRKSAEEFEAVLLAPPNTTMNGRPVAGGFQRTSRGVDRCTTDRALRLAPAGKSILFKAPDRELTSAPVPPLKWDA